jgi:hypothetical protein
MFADLVSGDCFIFNDDLYIKVSSCVNDFNAFNCKEDWLVNMGNNTVVTPISIELREIIL